MPRWKVERFPKLLISPQILGPEGDNINGPSVIRAPEAIANRIGKYLMYFGHHEGSHIRLAYAEKPEGPWNIHPAKVLSVDSLPWHPDHVASPDLHFNPKRNELEMYFHSPTAPMIPSTDPNYYRNALSIPQRTFYAVSKDGLHFTVVQKELGCSYFRVWKEAGKLYALPRELKPLYSSSTGSPLDFAPQPSPFACLASKGKTVRHSAVFKYQGTWWIFFSRIGDAPESILAASFSMDDWTISHAVEILRPEEEWEGASVAVKPSLIGRALDDENALRDPCILEDDGELFLYYCVRGEHGIAGARLTFI